MYDVSSCFRPMVTISKWSRLTQIKKRRTLIMFQSPYQVVKPACVSGVSEHHTCCQSPKICYSIVLLFTCWQCQTSICKWHVGELSPRACVLSFLSNQKYFRKFINWTNFGRSWFCALKSAGICDWFLCHCIGNIHNRNRFKIIFCKPSHPWLILAS